jgi:phage tail sheath protein FI
MAYADATDATIFPRCDALRQYPPCGFIAGIYAGTGAARGVWKAPSGTEARLIGALAQTLTDPEMGMLNRQGINCIRNFESQAVSGRSWSPCSVGGPSQGRRRRRRISSNATGRGRLRLTCTTASSTSWWDLAPLKPAEFVIIRIRIEAAKT